MIAVPTDVVYLRQINNDVHLKDARVIKWSYAEILRCAKDEFQHCYLHCNKVVESLKYRWLIKYSQVGFMLPVSRAIATLKVRVRISSHPY